METVSVGSRRSLNITDKEVGNIRAALKYLETDASRGGPVWFPGYGSVILSSPSEPIGFDYRAWLLGLDKWEGKRYRREDKEITISVPNSYLQWDIETVPQDSYQEYVAKLRELVQSAAARKGDQRSAAGGRQGHQKTPAFIFAKAKDAFKSLNVGDGTYAPESLPPGGTTDVGQHTGGQPPSTTWPLVKACLSALLESQHLLDKVMIIVKMLVLEAHAAKAMASPLSQSSVDDIFLALDEIAQAVMEFEVTYQFDKTSAAIVERLVAVRQKLDRNVQRQIDTAVDRMQISEEDSKEGCRSPELGNPSIWGSDVTLQAGGNLEPIERESMRSRALASSGWLPSPPPATTSSSFCQLWTWMESHGRLRDGTDRDAVHLVFSAVEHLMIAKAELLALNPWQPLPDSELSALQSIAGRYNTLVDRWLSHCETSDNDTESEARHSKPLNDGAIRGSKGPEVKADELNFVNSGSVRRMCVETRSVQLVVIWVAYALTHREVCQIYLQHFSCYAK
ncbi:hypothetical protein M427DRAFT_30927 [Gonapodya prolifera JEL478]|uniref:Uncharacterized protein n=1 Tax=Gonapodya prolifera (strain JEL478) TaxID=1344416 RepID=A0A139AJT3_GONPJ|nr:hypothetical protein M427DRAFT_30927 [Gonapodya prolifera JEL478]|eukprot:KXS16814.1 hypothetical protein M427DRAFT_30927 [Gonapodya prolifera JEL478]